MYPDSTSTKVYLLLFIPCLFTWYIKFPKSKVPVLSLYTREMLFHWVLAIGIWTRALQSCKILHSVLFKSTECDWVASCVGSREWLKPLRLNMKTGKAIPIWSSWIWRLQMGQHIKLPYHVSISCLLEWISSYSPFFADLFLVRFLLFF